MNLGINYFLNETPGVALDNFKIYFDFISGEDPSLLSNRSGDLNISGEIKNIYSLTNFENFYQKTGEGFLNSGLYIKLHNLTGVNLTNFTISFIYENLRKGGSTIISNIETGILNTFDEFGLPQSNLIFKGFEFGVTANNRLYFEYYSENGPDIFISDFSLSNKNSVFLSIIENNLLFGFYDFYKNSLFSNNFIIRSEYLFDPQNLYIGYNPESSGLYNFNQSYTGYISEFLLFSPSIYNYDIISLNSGYAHIYSSGSLVFTNTIISGVTGYLDEVTGFSTGVTGIESIATGIITDEWGVSYTGFEDIELTGLIPLFGVTPLSGEIDSFTGQIVTGENIILNYEFLNNLGKNHINFLSKIDFEDVLDLNGYIDYSGLRNIRKNINIKKERINNQFYIPTNINFSGTPIVFANGQLNISGELFLTGTPYNSGIFLTNDYYYNVPSRNFVFNNNYNEGDSVFIDIENLNNSLHIKNFFVASGTGQTVLTGWNDNLNKFYFNGQKLISGIHYEVSMDDIIFEEENPLYGGTTGILVAIPKSYNNTILQSGTNLVNFNNRYLYNFTEIYKNGIRQTLNTDYLELPDIDSNTGKGFFDVKKDLIYNNEGII
jgi:hypothetical protein